MRFFAVISTQASGANWPDYLSMRSEPVPASEEAAVSAPPVDARSGAASGARVLVIDDERQVVELFSEALRRQGHSVTVHTDPLDAMVEIESDPSKFDLIVTDQVMPRFSGKELATEVRNLRRDLPVILCTGHDREAAGVAENGAGVRCVLRKPVRLDELERAVSSCLQTP